MDFAIANADGTVPPKDTQTADPPPEPDRPDEQQPGSGGEVQPPSDTPQHETVPPGPQTGGGNPQIDYVDPNDPAERQIADAIAELKRFKQNANRAERDYLSVLEIERNRQNWSEAQKDSFAAQCGANGIDFDSLLAEAQNFAAQNNDRSVYLYASIPLGLAAVAAAAGASAYSIRRKRKAEAPRRGGTKKI